MAPKARSILDLDAQELEEVINTGQMLEGVTFERLETRDDYDKLFKHRGNPKQLARYLLRDKLKAHVLRESPEIKERRLSVQERELALKERQVTNQTYTQERIAKALNDIRSGQDLLAGRMASLEQKLDQLLMDQNISQVVTEA